MEQSNPTQAMKKITVLLADDHAVVRAGIRQFLERSELINVIAEVGNGQQAQKIIQEKTLDVIILDIQMPVMNGIEATRKLKELYPDLPIIAQTAYAVPGDTEKARNLGCDDVIAKPIIISKLMKLLNKYL